MLIVFEVAPALPTVAQEDLDGSVETEDSDAEVELARAVPSMCPFGGVFVRSIEFVLDVTAMSGREGRSFERNM